MVFLIEDYINSEVQKQMIKAMPKCSKRSITKPLIYQLLVVVVLLSRARTQKVEDQVQFVKIGQQVSGTLNLNRPNETVFFLSLPDQIDSNSVLFFQGGIKNNETREVSITVLKTNQPQAPSLIQCRDIRFSDCYIEARQLQNIDLLTITVACDNTKKQCPFIFDTYWSKFNELPLNQEVFIEFNGQEDKRMYFFDGTQLKDEEINEFNIILLPIVQNTASQPFYQRTKLLVNNNGSNPSAKSYQFRSLEIWNQGQAIFLEKQDVLNQYLTILVDGQKNEMFSIKCQVLKKKQHIVRFQQYLQDYIKPNSEHYYHLDFEQLISLKDNAQIYFLEFSVFEGSLSIAFFKDKQYKVPFETGGTIHYSGESRYSFSRESLIANDIQSLQVKISSSNVATTFSALFDQHRSTVNQSLIELEKNKYELTSIEDRQMFYYRYLGSAGTIEYPEFKFTLHHFINPSQFNKHSPFKLRVCGGKYKLVNCLNSNKTQQLAVELKEGTHFITTKNQNSGTYIYDITVNKQELGLSKYRSVYIIIQAVVAPDFKKGFLSLFIQDKNFVKVMTQGILMQQKISNNQANFYIYKNFNSENLQMLSINILKVSGEITAYVTREDPRWKDLNNLNVILPKLSAKVPDQQNMLFQLDQDIQQGEQIYSTNKPVFLTIIGQARSNFYLICQIITKQQEQQQQNKQINKTIENPIIYGVTNLQSQKDYNFVLTKIDSQVLLFKPTGFSQTVTVQIKATIAVGLCQIQDYTQLCKDKKQIHRGTTLRIIVPVKKQGQLFKDIIFRVMSLSQEKAVQVTANFIQYAPSQCVQKQIGKSGHQAIEKSVCFKYKLNRTTSNIIGYFQRTEIAPLDIMILICDQKYEGKYSSRFQISSKQITQICNKKNKKNETLGPEISVVLSSPYENSVDNEKMRVFYSLQYADQVLYLPDGIAMKQQVVQVAGKKAVVSPISDLIPNPIKKYYFKLINNVNTSIIVNQISGTGKLTIFAMIGKDENIHNQKDFKSLTVYNSNLKDQNKPYFTNQNGHQFLKITQSQIESADCKQNQCTLVIYIDDGQELPVQLKERIVMYSIQVSQNSVIMAEHVLYATFLLKDQSVFYRYDCTKYAQKVLFEAQDNNENCVKILAGSNQFTGENNVDKIVQANQITVECPPQPHKSASDKLNQQIHSQFGSIFFTVKATADCPVTSSVQSTSYKFKNIYPGVPSRISLKPGQVQFFSFRHIPPNTGFKIVTMQTHGNIRIYANQSNAQLWEYFYQQKANQSINIKGLPFRDFKLKNKFYNALEVNQDSDGYCSKCTYIVAVQAIDQLVNSSILFISRNPNQDSMEILINTNQFLYDEIERGQQPTVLKVHKALKGKIHFNLLQGQLNVKVKHQKSLIEKSVGTFNEKQVIEYDFVNKETNQGIDSWDPITVEISNPNFDSFKAVYYVYVSRTDDSQLKADLIQQGFPQIVRLGEQGQDTVCVKGYLSFKNTQDQQKFQIMCDDNSYDYLNFTLKINEQDKSQSLQIQKYSNGVELYYRTKDQKQRSQINKYILCIKMDKTHLKDTELSLIQSSNTNLLPQGDFGLVSTQQNFILHPIAPKFKFILDVSTCFGNTKMFVTNQYADTQQEQPLKDIQSRQIDDLTNTDIPWRNQSHHLFKVIEDEDVASTKFIHIESKLAAVRWIPYDQEKQIGTGYQNFVPGKIDFSLQRNRLIVKFQPIRKILKSQFQVNHGQNQIEQNILNQKFRIIIGSQVETIRSAASCWSSSDQNRNNGFYWSQINLKEVEKVIRDEDNKVVQLNIEKKDLRKAILNQQRRMLHQQKYRTLIDETSQQLNDKIYVILVADVQIKSNFSELETYHFSYEVLKLPMKQTLNDDDSWSSLIKENYTVFIILCIIMAVLLFSFIAHICLRKLLPVLGHIWNKKSLVEQQNPEDKGNQKQNKIQDVLGSGTQMNKDDEQVHKI